MKAKLLAIISAICLLSACSALDGKCNYLPKNNCGLLCHTEKPICRNWCGGSCKGDTCSACWVCDYDGDVEKTMPY